MHSINIPKINNLLFFFLLLVYLGTLPYFNLVLRIKLIAIVFLVFLAFIFRISGRLLLKAAILLLMMALIFSLWHKDSLAESVGEVIYGLLFLGIFKELITFLRNI